MVLVGPSALKHIDLRLTVGPSTASSGAGTELLSAHFPVS